MIAVRTLLSAAICAALAACQTTTDAAVSSPATKSNQAYAAHRVDDANRIFANVCLAPQLSVASALKAADAADFGYKGAHYGPKRTGTPRIVIGAPRGAKWPPRDQPDQAFTDYHCAVTFRGSWAKESLAQVRKSLSAQGFSIVKPLTTKAMETTTPSARGVALLYEGTVRRAGRNFTVSVAQLPSGQDSRNLYLSQTILHLEIVFTGSRS